MSTKGIVRVEKQQPATTRELRFDVRHMQHRVLLDVYETGYEHTKLVRTVRSNCSLRRCTDHDLQMVVGIRLRDAHEYLTLVRTHPQSLVYMVEQAQGFDLYERTSTESSAYQLSLHYQLAYDWLLRTAETYGPLYVPEHKVLLLEQHRDQH